MYEININMLLGIIIIAFILLIAIILIFIAYMCHDKRRFRSIDKYNELIANRYKTYNESMKDYNENIEKSGVKTHMKSKWKLILSIIKLFKRGSK